MNKEQYNALILRETDIESVKRRLCGNEQLFCECLKAFIFDPTMSELNQSVSQKTWDEAFTAAHALKGVAGNMGFIPLMHSVGQLLILIRGGRTREIPQALANVNSSYRDIIDGINCFFALADEHRKEE